MIVFLKTINRLSINKFIALTKRYARLLLRGNKDILKIEIKKKFTLTQNDNLAPLSYQYKSNRNLLEETWHLPAYRDES